MKSCAVRAFYGLMGIVCSLMGVVSLVSWFKGEGMSGVQGNGLLVYVAIFFLLGLVGIWGALPTRER